MRPLEKYTYSKISTYIQCPYRYKKLYIDKLAEPPNRYNSPGLTAADVLEHVHRKNLYKDLNLDTDIPVLVDRFWIPKQYKKDYDGSLPSHLFLHYPSKEQEVKERELLIKCIKDYYTNYVTEKPFGVEVPFIVPFQDFYLSGKVDLLRKNELDYITVIDNKYTNSLISNIAESIQLYIYYEALSLLLKRYKIQKVGYCYLKMRKESIIPTSFIKLEEMRSKIISIVFKIRQKEFPKTPNTNCYFCILKGECQQ